MTRYGEVLELQLALQKDWWSEQLEHVDPRKRTRTVEQLMEIAHGGLETATPYFSRTEIVDGVEAAAANLPTSTLVPELLPSEDGFSLLERPLASTFPSLGQPSRLAGWLWTRSEGSIFLSPLLYRVETGQRVLGTLINWPFGESPEDVSAGGNGIFPRLDKQAAPELLVVRDGLLVLTKLFMAWMLFVQQRIARATPTQAERPTRRRLERADWPGDPVIQVVELRRRLYEHGPSASSESPVNWSTRWYVSGHWRQQVCGPNRSQRRPVFVLPYTKGPNDRPLKPPPSTIFAVIR